MAHSPSQEWDGGRLTKRALDTRGETEENTAQAVTGRPNDLAVEEREPALPNSTFAERARARRAATKAVEEKAAENKAVKSSRRK